MTNDNPPQRFATTLSETESTAEDEIPKQSLSFRLKQMQCSVPFLISLIVHCTLILLFALIVFPILRSDESLNTVVQIDSDFNKLIEAEVSATNLSVAEMSNAQSPSSSLSANIATAIANSTREWKSDVSFSESTVAPQTTSMSGLHISKQELLTEIEVPMRYMPFHQHRGETRLAKVEAVQQISGNLAGDLEGMAGDGDAIVVWLLDQSLSMQKDMDQLAEGLLGTFKSIEEDQSSKMLHYVVAFGDNVNVIQDATIKSYVAAKAIYKVPPNPSGVENTFQAVEWCVDNLFNARKWKRFKERQKLLVIWTDESGDDYRRLEQTIQKCLHSNVRVDIIGPSAVLGAQTGYTAYLHPDDGRVYQLPVHRGPDSAFPQKLNLGYWYRGVPLSYSESFQGPYPGTSPLWHGGSNLSSLLSGFSPYALTRLTRQTGGKYTIYDRPGDRPPFQLDAIQEYMPDFRSIAEIKNEYRQRPLRQIVLAASAVTWNSNQTGRQEPSLNLGQMGYSVRYEPSLQYQMVTLPNRVRQEGNKTVNALKDVEQALSIYVKAASLPEFEADPEVSARRQAEEMRTKKESKFDIEDSQRILDEAEEPQISLLEQLYKAEPSPRWLAWCDLNFGRLLAISVRQREYLTVVQPLLNNRKNGLNSNTNHVSLRPTRILRGGAVSQKRLQIAEKLLRRCIDENPGTPWSIMAERELRDPCGIELIQHVIEPPKPTALTTMPSRPQTSRPNLPSL